MKKKSGFELRDVCGEKLIIAQGIENIDFSKMINLNETAACVWQALPAEAPFTAQDAADALMAEYDVDPEVALRDATALLEQFKEEGLLED
ncbi:MAG: PqqD family protein [Bacteroidaceae bacterium]|nr:PqqD family protein [Bacteroidaceae bacterium]MBR6925862.1 PqqD family protein [Bacteroidaceae bacterium]